jgi:hypothetical protein
MNPETKLVLDALSKRFDDMEAKWEQSFKDAGEKLEKEFGEVEEKWELRFSHSEDKWERQIADLTIVQDARMNKLERVAADLEDWKPGVEGAVDDIRMEVGKLSKHWERVVRARSPPLLPISSPLQSDSRPTPPGFAVQPLPHPPGDPQQPKPPDLICGSASWRPPASDKADRPHGHREDVYYREDDYGSVTTLAHPPVKGACKLSTPPPSPRMLVRSVLFPGNRARDSTSGCSGMGKLPKMNFPQFDGDNPKLWLSRAMDYFELYEVEEHRWIMVASMNFVIPGSRWLQSVQHKIKSCSWSMFASMVLDRFGRDQHELLIR